MGRGEEHELVFTVRVRLTRARGDPVLRDTLRHLILGRLEYDAPPSPPWVTAGGDSVYSVYEVTDWDVAAWQPQGEEPR